MRPTPKCADAKKNTDPQLDNAYTTGEEVQVKSSKDGIWKPATIADAGDDNGKGYTVDGDEEEYDTSQIRVLMPGDVVEALGEDDNVGLRRATVAGVQKGDVSLTWKDGGGEAKVAAEKVKAVDYAIVN